VLAPPSGATAHSSGERRTPSHSHSVSVSSPGGARPLFTSKQAWALRMTSPRVVVTGDILGRSVERQVGRLRSAGTPRGRGGPPPTMPFVAGELEAPNNNVIRFGEILRE